MSIEECQTLLEELNVTLDAETARARIVEVKDEEVEKGEREGFVEG